MTEQRAGITERIAWLATAERHQAAWSMSVETIGVGVRRSGNRSQPAGKAVQAGRALARVSDRTGWGGLDFLAGDALVAEYDPQTRLAWLKDNAADVTPGIAPWREEAVGDLPANIRQARPLEAVVARTAAVGPGFEREHVLFTSRAHLIAHHRPDNPPINSTPISDPGKGDGDWTGHLHNLTWVRPFPESFCGGGKTGSGDDKPLYAALLNFTKSAGDNTGWGGAHFAEFDALLSAEGYGFAHPADDGNHRLAYLADGGELHEGGLHITRTKFGDTGSGILYSPAEFINAQWKNGGRGTFIRRVEWREDFNARHATRCGSAPGTKKWMSWDSFREYPPPHDPPTDDPPPEVPPPTQPPIEPSPIYVPWEGPTRPSTATPHEIERPSDYGHPVPDGPDRPGETDWPEGGHSSSQFSTLVEELDHLWQHRFRFTERRWNERVPLSGHGIWGNVYENATPAAGQERWRSVFSRLPSLVFDDDGFIDGRRPGLGPGWYTLAGSDVDISDLYTTVNSVRGRSFNDFSLGVFSAYDDVDSLVVADAELGIGSRHPTTERIIKGQAVKLDWNRLQDADNPDAVYTIRDEEGVDSATANHTFKQTVQVTGGEGDDDPLDVSTETTGDNPRTRVFQARATSANDDSVTLCTFSLSTVGTYRIRVTVMGRRDTSTGGVGIGDSAGYELDATFKNVGGTITQVGSATQDAHEDATMSDADASFSISGTTVLLRVAGAKPSEGEDLYLWHMPWSRFAGPMGA